MDKDKFNELIKSANQESKDDFLRFITGIYGVDECVFDHIWKIPVISSENAGVLLTKSLFTKTEDELLYRIDKFIDNELGNAEGCFISLSKIENYLTIEELEELKRKIDSGELKLDYNAIIIYNEPRLQEEYEKLLEPDFEKTRTQEELDQIFVNYVKEMITHERCHLNANCLVIDEFDSDEINGSELGLMEEYNILTGKRNTIDDQKNYSIRNEVLVDTLSHMMNNYQEGDSIEDCLFRIIEDRNGKSQYIDFDDRDVLTMYTLFPEKLTKWAVFGAYDSVRENKLQKIIIDVCGTDKLLDSRMLNKKVKEYITTLGKGNLSEKQIKMLKMLGFSIHKKINKEDMKEVAISEKALNELYKNLLNIGAFIQKMQKGNSINEK